jgi:hypothetical protein
MATIVRHMVHNNAELQEPWLARFDITLDYQSTALAVVRRLNGNLERACDECQCILFILTEARDLSINLHIDRDLEWQIKMGEDITRYLLAYRHIAALRPPRIAYKWLHDANAGNERMHALAVLGYNERNRKVFQAIDIVMNKESV